jgi:hypothetical protein
MPRKEAVILAHLLERVQRVRDISRKSAPPGRMRVSPMRLIRVKQVGAGA